jgi:hypothetical protein
LNNPHLVDFHFLGDVASPAFGGQERSQINK